ncbi:inositol monophosphatase family protein [Paenibacillus radicis (ex Xue et al. 2023)]|uniref:Inositol monophosphatase n=1 Tax=Paenibacillus radicis (ex Xue et al. 2023) TaxID=2972489 RepID=A0ABT1YLC2_9BACL|nr:inositol monophosphatase [Paenibacillus radicis (ex Xue et al. 2023)]MCR8633986.1 inositol monophosphatase [Paenibacillus radicis (ex Xue et al. 2023)]
MEATLQKAIKVAVEAAKAAGHAARVCFDEGFTMEEKDEFGDVLTEADLKAEHEILSRLGAAFPDHQIRSEESGWSGVESDWLWLVDPLDGTNNFAVGLPLFGVSLTLIYKKEPVLGVIYDTILDKMYTAVYNQGAACNEQALRIQPRTMPNRLTVGWIQGHKVQQEARAVQLRAHIEKHTKRMMRLWAPTMQWSMLARGQLDGIVLYNSEGDDLYSGLLLVREAGGLILDFNGNPFTGMNPEPYIIACPPDRKDVMLKLVRDGLAEQL